MNKLKAEHLKLYFICSETHYAKLGEAFRTVYVEAIIYVAYKNLTLLARIKCAYEVTLL